MAMKPVNEILKQRRLELNMTMLDVAKMVGVSEGTVSRWESGDIANMRRDKITSLAKTLQMSPAVIMGWTDDLSINNNNNLCFWFTCICIMRNNTRNTNKILKGCSSIWTIRT